MAGISPRSIWYWRSKDKAFDSACRAADEEAAGWFQDRMRARAAEGSDRMIQLALEMAGRWSPNPTITIDQRAQTVDLSGLSAEALASLIDGLSTRRDELPN